MKLTQVQINNFRCFESLTVPLQPDVNVFVGVNGAGKSAILDAISLTLVHVAGILVTGGDKVRIQSIRGINRYRDIKISNIKKNDYVFSKNSFSIQASADIESYRAPKEVMSYVPKSGILEWEHRFKSIDEDKFFSGFGHPSLSKVHSFFKKQFELASEGCHSGRYHQLPCMAYYRAHRNIKNRTKINISFDTKLGIKEAFHKIFDASDDYQTMIEWFYKRENSELRHKFQISNDLEFEYSDLKSIRRAISIAIEGVKKIFFRDNPPSLMVELKQNDELKLLDIEQLSDGYRNLLGIIMDFARRMAQSNPEAENPLEAPGILLIDEIELHLHPRWQQIIIPRLREIFPNTQIIAATHSPQVLTTVESRCIHILRDQKIYAAPPGSYGAESKRMLERVLGAESRPPASENRFVRELRELFDLINREEYETAKTKLESLLEKTGVEDPALVEAQTMIENRLWEKELGI